MTSLTSHKARHTQHRQLLSYPSWPNNLNFNHQSNHERDIYNNVQKRMKIKEKGEEGRDRMITPD